MHLLIDARMYSPNFTGIGRYVYEITQELFRQKPDWKFTLFLGAEEYKKFSAPSPNITAVLAPEKIYSAKEQTSFLKKLMSVKGDLTWFPHFNVPLMYPRKFVVTVHDLTLSKFPGKKHSFVKNLIYNAIIKNALWRSKKILTVSENTKRDLMNDENVQENKIVVAGNAVGDEFLDFIPDRNFDLKKLGISQKFFLYTGQWRSHKNILGMTKAFHQFLQRKRAENPDFSAQLVLTGKPNPLYPEVLDYRKKHTLENEIIPVGLVSESDLLHLYSLAEVFVFPSFYEGFGIPPLEAMAMKTPVAASTSSAIPEVCGEGAVYFSPENTEEMSKKMEVLFCDEELRKKMIKKGLEQIKKFSWQDSAKKIIDTFESV
jgi:glycosyltransferase involved in cell wall biosynthesis